MIKDFCSDVGSMGNSSRTNTAVINAARYAGIEGSDRMLDQFYLPVLRANGDVLSAESSNALNRLGGGYSRGDVPDWEKSCVRRVRKMLAEDFYWNRTTTR